jgi:hypothetical protein
VRAAAVTVAVLIGVPGCGSEPEEGPLDGAKADAPETTSSAAPREQPPEVPPATDDAKGRRAFAEWFVQALAYGNRTNDPGPIVERAIVDPELSCTVCESYETYLAERESKGITYRPSTYDVKRVFETGRQQGVHVYDLIAADPGGQDVDEDGTVVKRYPANARQLIEVGIRFTDGAYQISGWKVGRGAQG